ncbi:hypothetical protein KGF57_001001 [Candida theae]|uniref:Uncharacterized protein n=1 Tax=Candida theae TaxID=1198502 RepID=A0AAD5G0C9_9ASCO|nr:uncharacterized protein KGF57_001001 [Candida theae]KAI5964509.1 hypothetical protein KGF57_001001 [Candida theae]
MEDSKGSDDELNISPAFPIDDVNTDQEVIQYLQGVRSEASAMNHILYHEREDHIIVQDHHTPIHSEPTVTDVKFHTWSTQLIHNFKVLKERIRTQDQNTISYDTIYSLKWKTAFKNSPPDINYFVYALDRKLCFDILVELTKRLSITMKETFGQWLWKVFLKLDNILEASECAILRDLAKTAIKLKSKLDESTTVANSIAGYTFDMIIAIVGLYYGQSDLLQG